MSASDDLWIQERAKRIEIERAVASLGVGMDAAAEAELLIEEWIETVARHPGGAPQNTPLQRLLAEHHEIRERLLAAEGHDD